MRRALRIGEMVCIREECIRPLSGISDAKIEAHVSYKVVDRGLFGKRVALVLELLAEGGATLYVWPSEIHLADSAVEQMWRREQKMIAEVDAMKAARMKARKRGKKPTKTKQQDQQ